MPRTWTPEQRAAAAERIRANRPWEKSTGPRTRAGKRNASKNAYKHGGFTETRRIAHKMLKANREFLRMYMALPFHQEDEVNELMKIISQNNRLDERTKNSDNRTDNRKT